jgi:hypothetical protein
VSTTFKPAGAPASNQYGQFTVRYASTAQQNYIRRLLAERDHEFGDLDPATVNVQNASHIIDQLLRTPIKNAYVVPASDRQLDYIRNLRTQRDGADSFLQTVPALDKLNAYQAKKVIDGLLALPRIFKEVVPVGAYRHNGQIYSVRQGRESGRRHAFEWSAESKQWLYAGSVTTHALVIEERLSLAEAMSFGVQTGSCIHCGRTLTDKNSVRFGMGTTCRKKYEEASC